MNAEWVRRVCLSFPHAAEQVTWGSDLTFRVAGKIFAVTVTEIAPVWLSFKASPENFAELTERAGIIPAPYLARAQWVALETKDALPLEELTGLLRESYDLVVAKLPGKTRENLASRAPSVTPKAATRKPAGKKRAAEKGKRTKKRRT
jgi:predicted DNA-binding protein (MmcQ/YjbR family)